MKTKITFPQNQKTVSMINQNQAISFNPVTSINQSTELGESLIELNKDELSKDINMSSIDMRARLHNGDMPFILAMDFLVALKVLPTECLVLTRQKKRLSVSLEGRGREDIVRIVAGKRELEKEAGTGGFVDKMKGLFSGGNKQ